MGPLALDFGTGKTVGSGIRRPGFKPQHRLCRKLHWIGSVCPGCALHPSAGTGSLAFGYHVGLANGGRRLESGGPGDPGTYIPPLAPLPTGCEFLADIYIYF